MGTVELGTLIAVVGCFVGLGGWLAGRDRRIAGDGEWKGMVNAKLDDIKSSVAGTSAKLVKINEALSEHGERLSAAESSIQQAHRRIDEIVGGRD
jgi:outer membrane murein-binding lipoprotein Lpp